MRHFRWFSNTGECRSPFGQMPEGSLGALSSSTRAITASIKVICWVYMVSKEKKRNKNLEKMHWSAADPTFQEATDYVMHFLMRQQQEHTVSKSPKMSLFEFSLLNETFWRDFQTLILHWIWFMLAMTNCDGRRKILNVVLGMWGECFIYFFLTFQWRPWRIMWRLWNGCKTVGWWLLLHLERTMESSKPLIQFCGWTTCKQTTLVFTNALSHLTVDVKFSHLENWGWEVRISVILLILLFLLLQLLDT